MMKRKLIVVLESDQMNLAERQVNQAIRSLWNELARSDRSLEIRAIRLKSSPGEIVRHLPLLQRAHRLVFPAICAPLLDVFGFLRAGLELDTPSIFYLLGHASSGPGYFLAFDRYLLEHDQFVVCEEGEARILGMCFERARSIRVPYLVPIPGSKRAKSRGKPAPFIYAGRISEQKNLHTLICAFALFEGKHPGSGLELRIYGSEDRLGSPDFGIPSRRYLRYLKKLCRDLGTRGVRWMGFADPHRLDTELGNPHVFVSPSLHIGENFGMAAFRSLGRSNPAVLSEWGGHRELGRIFGSVVHLVPVYGGETGPFVSPIELCSAMERTWRKERSRIDPRKIRAAEKGTIRELGKALRSPRRALPLRQTERYRKLRARLLRRGRSGVFQGYADPAARPLFLAMGMTALPPSAKHGKAYPAPWVRFLRGEAKVEDPMRGSFRYRGRLAWKRLLENGFAFHASVLPAGKRGKR